MSDSRALANPLVAGEFGLRFYAAAPLVTHDGHRLGTLNVMDFEPRDFTEEDERTLAELAGAVMDQMELRISSRKAVQSLSNLIRHAQEQDDEGGLDTRGLTTICAWTKSILVDGAWMTFEEFLETRLGLKVTHGIRPDEAARIIEQAESKTTR